jgi:hypothetical protein
MLPKTHHDSLTLSQDRFEVFAFPLLSMFFPMLISCHSVDSLLFFSQDIRKDIRLSYLHSSEYEERGPK